MANRTPLEFKLSCTSLYIENHIQAGHEPRQKRVVFQRGWMLTRQGGRVVYALTYAYALFSFIFMVFMTQITFDKKRGTENADRPVGIDPAPTSTASFVLCARPFATSVFLPLVPYHSLFVPFSPHDLFRRCLGRLAQAYATSHTIFPSK